MTVPFLPAAMWTSARPRLEALALRCALTSAVLAGCGPSFEAIQEGNLRFAHCDRLDIDPNIAPSHRLHCWREWRRVYTYAQTRDRVEYAQRRIAEVVSGDTEPAFVLPSGERRAERSATPSVLSPEVPPPALVVPAVVPIAAPSTSPPDEAAVQSADVKEACRAHCKADKASCPSGCETLPTGCGDCLPFEKCVQACKTEGFAY